MRRILFVILILTATLGHHQAAAQKTISVADFGLKAYSPQNAVPYVIKALEKCRELGSGTTLYFPKGRYNFVPQKGFERTYFESNTTDNNPKRLAILIDSMQGLTIDGGGSMFVMQSQIQPITVDGSTDILLKNFSIDWDVPLTAQAEVVGLNSDYFDIKIDTLQFPYIIENNRLCFIGSDWKSEIFSIMQFDPKTRFVSPQTGDNTGWIAYNAKELKKGVVRMSEEQKRYPKMGALLVLRHSARDHAGIFITGSKNLSLQDINVHHTAGLGILSQMSENLSFLRVSVAPNRDKNRILSGHDDGFHFMGCRGQIEVDSCYWAGLMDDPINIHGTAVRIIEKLSNTKLLCRYMHHQSVGMRWGNIGDKVGYIDNSTMHTMGYGTIKGYKPISETDFEIELSKDIPTNITAGEALENLEWTPSVTIRNSHFGSCRARGLLLSTPGKIIVENNTFESSGSAILIAGDANQWYETGAVKDVLIRGNTFNYPCMSSLYQFCEAIISIYPEVPQPNINLPYHRNIRIDNNIFHPFDYPILYAKSTDGLTFCGNTLIRDTTYAPFHHRKDGITLEWCKNVSIKGNSVVGDVLGKSVKLVGMPKSELKIDDQFFKLKEK